MRPLPAGPLLAVLAGAALVACRGSELAPSRSSPAGAVVDDRVLAADAPLAPHLVPLPRPPGVLVDFAWADTSLYALSRPVDHEDQGDLWRWTRLDEPPRHITHMDGVEFPEGVLLPDPKGARLAFRVVRPSEHGGASVDVVIVEGATAALTWIAESAEEGVRFSRFGPMVWSPAGDAIALGAEVGSSRDPTTITLLYTVPDGRRRYRSEHQAADWRPEGLYLTRLEEDLARGEWLPAFLLLRPGETTPVRVPEPPRIVSPDGEYRVRVDEGALAVRSKDGGVRRFVATREGVREGIDWIKYRAARWLGPHGLLLESHVPAEQFVLDLETMKLRRLLPEGRFRVLEVKHDGRTIVVETVVARCDTCWGFGEKKQTLIGEIVR